MNIFGLIATAIICGTVFGISLLFLKKGVTITHITKSENNTQTPVLLTADHVQIKDEEQISQNSMDSVIAAVNDLMGVPKEEVNGGNK